MCKKHSKWEITPTFVAESIKMPAFGQPSIKITPKRYLSAKFKHDLAIRLKPHMNCGIIQTILHQQKL